MSEENRLRLFENDSFSQALGMEIVSIDGDSAVVSMPFDDRHRNSLGNTHGGAIFSLADMAFVVASHAYNEVIVNAQSSISYLSAGKVGPLIAYATPLQLGRKLVIYDIKVYDATKAMVANVTITGYVKKAAPLNCK